MSYCIYVYMYAPNSTHKLQNYIHIAVCSSPVPIVIACLQVTTVLAPTQTRVKEGVPDGTVFPDTWVLCNRC